MNRANILDEQKIYKKIVVFDNNEKFVSMGLMGFQRRRMLKGSLECTLQKHFRLGLAHELNYNIAMFFIIFIRHVKRRSPLFD